MKPFAERFYKSNPWKLCRKAYIDERKAIDGGLCEMCHERKGYIVHHVIELSPSNINDVSITLNFDNLQYVCKKCHDEHHGFFTPSKNRLFFDSDGQPIPP